MNLKKFIDNILPNSYDDNMFDSDGNFNPNYNSFKKTGLIAKILEEHWDNTYNKNKVSIDIYRSNASKEIQKIIDCHNKNLGGSIYVCPKCNSPLFISHTCKSRMCSSCGYKYKIERVNNIVQAAYKIKHRQIVFTIPKELRNIFFDISNINILFAAVKETIYSMANNSFKSVSGKTKKKKYKSKQKFMPGFFAFLHTFGRDLKFNPHIHILIAEAKLNKLNKLID